MYVHSKQEFNPLKIRDTGFVSIDNREVVNLKASIVCSSRGN